MLTYSALGELVARGFSPAVLDLDSDTGNHVKTPMISSSLSVTMPEHYRTLPQAIILPVLAGGVSLLSIPLLVSHVQARNFSLTVLVLSIFLLNIQNIVNPIIWHNDDRHSWWSGVGLCDVETKLQIGFSVTLPGAAACLFRQLALILDTSQTGALPSPRAQLYNRIFEWTICLVFPIYLMSIHILVQPYRYFILNISGCQYSMDSSYMSNVLVLIWPVVVSLIGTSYSVVVMFRLVRYRNEVSTILSRSSMSKSRFVRLFLIAAVFIIVYTPFSIYTFTSNIDTTGSAWSWQDVHPPGWTTYIVKVVVDNATAVDRWIQVATGYCVLLVFGTASEVKSTYRQWAVATGLTRVSSVLRRKRARSVAQVESRNSPDSSQSVSC